MLIARIVKFFCATVVTIALIGCSSSSSSNQESLQDLIASSSAVFTTLNDTSRYLNSLTYEESNSLVNFDSDVEMTVNFDTDTITRTDDTKISSQSNSELLLITANDDAEITLTGDYDGTVLIVSTARVHLRLDNVHIAATSGSAIAIHAKKRTFIEVLEGTTNVLADSAAYTEYNDYDMKGTLFSENKLILTGQGNLDISSLNRHSIAADDGIIISEVNLTVTSSGKDAIHANDFIIIDSGVIDLSATKDGLQVEHGAIVINGGLITLDVGDDGIISGLKNDSSAEVKITDQTQAPAGTIAFYGGHTIINRSVEAVEAFGGLYIYGGTLEATATDDGLNGVLGILIAGGYVFGKATIGDGIDSNGYITISGGVTVAAGGSYPEGSIDNDAYGIRVIGGIFVGVGGSTSFTTEDYLTQGFVVFGSGVLNQNFVIQDEDDILLAYRATQSYSTLVISHPDLQKGNTYEVVRNGTLSGTAIFHGLYISPTITNYAITSSFTLSMYATQLGGTLGPEWSRGRP